VYSSTPVPFAVPQLSGCTALPLFTFVIVYGVPVTGKARGTRW
jgi:hypothetical protein